MKDQEPAKKEREAVKELLAVLSKPASRPILTLQKGREKDMSEVISTFSKNALEEIRVGITEFKGKKLIDLRSWYDPGGGEERKPTRKGLTLSVDLFPELKKAILALEQALIKAKLIDKGQKA